MYGCQIGIAKDGRRFVVTGDVLTRTPYQNRKFYRSISVAWLDDEGKVVSRESGPAGKFNQKHRPKYIAGRMVFDHGQQRYV